MIVNALLPASDAVVSAGWDGKLVYWDLESRKVAKTYQCESYINTLTWLNSSKKQVLAGGKSGYLILVEMWWKKAFCFHYQNSLQVQNWWSKNYSCYLAYTDIAIKKFVRMQCFSDMLLPTSLSTLSQTCRCIAESVGHKK